MRGSTMKTMGQGAHHLGTSLAPALPNSLLGRGIGASSLPAPPLVTTRAGPGSWRTDPRRLRRQHKAAAHDRRELAHVTWDTAAFAQTNASRQSQCRGLDTARRHAGCGLRQEVTLPRQRTTCRSGSLDLTSGPGGPAGFQRQDGIGRRLLGKGRRVRRVIPAWRGQRTATNQNGRRPSWTAWRAVSPGETAAVNGKTKLCTGHFLPDDTGRWRCLAHRT